MEEQSDSEMWREFSAYKKGQRASRRQNAPDQLRELGLAFTVHNEGAHYVLTTPKGRTIDFWPGTTLWHVRGTTLKGYGLHRLKSKVDLSKKQEM